MKAKRYTFVLDVGYPAHETKEFASDQEAMEYGKRLFDHTNASSVTVYEYDNMKQIGDFDCAEEF